MTKKKQMILWKFFELFAEKLVEKIFDLIDDTHIHGTRDKHGHVHIDTVRIGNLYIIDEEPEDEEKQPETEAKTKPEE